MLLFNKVLNQNVLLHLAQFQPALEFEVLHLNTFIVFLVMLLACNLHLRMLLDNPLKLRHPKVLALFAFHFGIFIQCQVLLFELL